MSRLPVASLNSGHVTTRRHRTYLRLPKKVDSVRASLRKRGSWAWWTSDGFHATDEEGRAKRNRFFRTRSNLVSTVLE
jgi:hypothetical protein